MTGIVAKFGLGKQKLTQEARETRTIAVAECKEDYDNLRKLAGPTFAAMRALARDGITVEFDGVAAQAGGSVQPELPPLTEGGGALPARHAYVHVSFTSKLSTGDWKMLNTLLAFRGGIKEGQCIWCETTQDDVEHDYNATKRPHTFLRLHLASHNPDPDVLAAAGKQYPYECPCCKEMVAQVLDPDGVSDDADMAHARAHFGSRLGHRPLLLGSPYHADGVTETEIVELVPVEFLHYDLRTTELVFGATILDYVSNKEIQKELAWFLRGNGIRVKIPIATRGKAANPKILKITFNGNTCDNLVQPTLYKQLVARFGGPNAEAKARGLKVWDSLSALVKGVVAGTQQDDTPENGHAQAVACNQAREAPYTSLTAIIGSDRVSACWYTHGSKHLADSFKALGPDVIQFCNHGVEMVNKMRKTEVKLRSSLKPEDRPVEAGGGERRAETRARPPSCGRPQGGGEQAPQARGQGKRRACGRRRRGGRQGPARRRLVALPAVGIDAAG